MLVKGLNTTAKPTYEGELIKFKSPFADVWLLDEAVKNSTYGYLEFIAVNPWDIDYDKKLTIATEEK